MRILVVEDDPKTARFLKQGLEEEGHAVDVAADGEAGSYLGHLNPYDLMLLDIQLPGKNGLQLSAELRREGIETPILMLTGRDSTPDVVRGLNAGADDYLTKPFNKNELWLKVRNGVNRQVKLREKLRAELMSTAPKVEVLSEDEQFLNSVKEKILERLSDEQLSVESLAEDMGMSRVQLYRKISGLTDISVNELIRKLRLQRAAQLISQNWGPISQVAYEVGFSNLSYFSKVFKEEFGVLPSEYAEK